MLKLETLKNFVIKENLIEELSDIDFLFESYEYDHKKPLEDLINDVIEWSYNNDMLEAFYEEHWDVLEDSESLFFLQVCKIKDQFALTNFYLYMYNSKNKYYYKIKSHGEFSNCMNTDGYFKILDKQNDDLVINNFKDKCSDIFNLDGELENDDLSNSSIDFY